MSAVADDERRHTSVRHQERRSASRRRPVRGRPSVVAKAFAVKWLKRKITVNTVQKARQRSVSCLRKEQRQGQPKRVRVSVCAA